MPANNSIAGLTHSRTNDGANSAVYSAAANESGMAMSIEMMVTLIVPMSSGRTLYLGIFDTGCHEYGAVKGEANERPSAVPMTSGRASRPTYTKIRKIMAMATSATANM